MIDICICTHNPQEPLFSLVLDAILRQTVGPGTFRLLVIDNASQPPVMEQTLKGFHAYGIPARIVKEAEPGIARARLRAMCETDAEWLLFVDDDNELRDDYVEQGLRFISEHPHVGCFGGKLLLAPGLSPPSWARPFLPYLAIKDEGEEVIMGHADVWGPWEPPTAGAFIHRSVLDRYQERAAHNDELFRLGRKGRKGLASCEDSLIMRGAGEMGKDNAYNPQMVLYHHLDERRFRLGYLIRLMYGYGRSHVILEGLLGHSLDTPPEYVSWPAFFRLLSHVVPPAGKQSWAFSLGILAYHWGVRSMHIENSRGERQT